MCVGLVLWHESTTLAVSDILLLLALHCCFVVPLHVKADIAGTHNKQWAPSAVTAQLADPMLLQDTVLRNVSLMLCCHLSCRIPQTSWRDMITLTVIGC